MENFKLCTVAKHFGIVTDEEKLHDAFYDIQLTRAIYEYITKN
jgi:DNA polymerase-3 subunit epsilon